MQHYLSRFLACSSGPRPTSRCIYTLQTELSVTTYIVITLTNWDSPLSQGQHAALARPPTSALAKYNKLTEAAPKPAHSEARTRVRPAKKMERRVPLPATRSFEAFRRPSRTSPSPLFRLSGPGFKARLVFISSIAVSGLDFVRQVKFRELICYEGGKEISTLTHIIDSVPGPACEGQYMIKERESLYGVPCHLFSFVCPTEELLTTNLCGREKEHHLNVYRETLVCTWTTCRAHIVRLASDGEVGVQFPSVLHLSFKEFQHVMDSRAAILFLATAVLSMATAGAMKQLYKLTTQIDKPCADVEEKLIQLSKLKVDMASVNIATVNAAFQVNREIDTMDVNVWPLFNSSMEPRVKLEDLEPATIFRT
uniref:Uncharacterized protein n=1 Tax=Timema douglasi TaxID=61478 RepID=A0A7R8VKH6_TIMDO|nr:unnamed protein product [Timema douglasi]